MSALAVGAIANLYCVVRRIEPPHFIDQMVIAALGVFFAPSSKKKTDEDDDET